MGLFWYKFYLQKATELAVQLKLCIVKSLIHGNDRTQKSSTSTFLSIHACPLHDQPNSVFVTHTLENRDENLKSLGPRRNTFFLH